jgi:iron complex outermembrane receptor protein
LAVSAALGVAAVLSIGSQQVNAQQAERVTITGSNIPRAQTETASPVITLSREAMEASGKATVAEYLQTLSVDGQGSLPTGFGNGFAAGSTAISLRGMGATSTLVLVNGRRMAPFGRADDGQKIFTDLSSIPMELVDRIEILMDGASAIYGADAIAGVVNIILRESFNGSTGKFSTGVSQIRKGAQNKASLTHGFGNLAADGFNVMLNAELSKSEQIFTRDINRDWIGKGDLRPWGYGLESAGGFNAGNNPASNVRRQPPMGAVRNPVTGVYQALPGCAQFSKTTDQTGVAPGGCLYYQDQFRSMQPAIDSINLFGRVTWQLSDGKKAYAEVGFNNQQTEFYAGSGGTSVTPIPLSFLGAANYASGSTLTNGRVIAPILIAATHPDNPFGVATRLRYQAWDVGPDRRQTDNSAMRAAFGLTGNAWGWDYNTAYSHSESSLDLKFKNALNMSVVRAALSDPASQYFPYRIGVNAGLNPASLYSAMRVDLLSVNKTKMDVLDIRGSRDLMQLAGGPMSLAAGAEYRRESYDSPPFPGTVDGSVSVSYVGSQGTQHVAAVYAEALAPVHKMLELSAALRHDNYDHFNSTTPKLGIKFTPVRQLALRGTYSEGFRAPGATESSPASQSAGTATARDPVRCPVTGAAADCAASFALITSGNPSIKPEKSKGYTLGAVWDPTPNTGFSLDWWKIQRTDEINQMTLVNAAALPPCTQVRQDNDLPGIPCSGTLVGAFAPYMNSARSDLRGVDVGFRQRFNLGEYGKAAFELRWSHLVSWQRTEVDGSSVEYAGTHGNCDISNCIGTPKEKVNAALTWDKGNWRVTGLVNWRSSFENKDFKGADCAVTYADGTDAPGGCKIAAFWTTDISVRWEPEKSLQIFGSVQNLFDKVAPLDPYTYGALGYNPMDYSGAIGRFFKVGLRYQFK